MISPDLIAGITGRSKDFFQDDFEARRQGLHDALHGRRVLVIGGAGSIGAATIRAMVPFSPAALHVVDINENNLAELVRDLRSAPDHFSLADFQTMPIDFGSGIMRRFLKSHPPYDLVFNFAALKHVRSEKDVFSLLRMLDTNVVAAARFLDWLSESGEPSRYFAVSTDKAANPVSLMGASKRLMEHVMFSESAERDDAVTVTSARFANVAFSEGSLLDSFLRRMDKRQPLAAPSDIRRYFISLAEAGQICLLSALCLEHGQIGVPTLDPCRDLIPLTEVAHRVLAQCGFVPEIHHDEAKAKQALAEAVAHGRYPLLVTPSDTSGEKPYEEFVGEGETTLDTGMASLRAIPYLPAAPGAVREFLAFVEPFLDDPARPVDKAGIVERIAALLPQFHHRETGKNLDQRM